MNETSKINYSIKDKCQGCVCFLKWFELKEL